MDGQMANMISEYVGSTWVDRWLKVKAVRKRAVKTYTVLHSCAFTSPLLTAEATEDVECQFGPG